jgi:hypothetical protein
LTAYEKRMLKEYMDLRRESRKLRKELLKSFCLANIVRMMKRISVRSTTLMGKIGKPTCRYTGVDGREILEGPQKPG